jgi:hypothetical protein
VLNGARQVGNRTTTYADLVHREHHRPTQGRNEWPYDRMKFQVPSQSPAAVATPATATAPAITTASATRS